MSDQAARQMTAAEIAERDLNENFIITHYERLIRLQKPKTELAMLRRDEIVAIRQELAARVDLDSARKQLRQLALQSDLITVEEATKYKQEPKNGPDRN